jgi:sec-independent protein translocase protein TatB
MFFEGLSVHLMIAAAVALIVVGPKDLPVMLRRFGQFMAKVRAMAAEFRASFDEMARQSELDELRKEVEAMRQGQFADMASLEANQTFDEISQGLSDVGVQLNTPVYSMAQTEHVEVAAAPKARARKASVKKAARRKPPAKVAAKKSAAPKVAAAKPAAKAKAPAAKSPAKQTKVSASRIPKGTPVKSRARKAATS